MDNNKKKIHQDNKMASRSLQPGDYVLLTAAGKSQTYLIKNITLEGIYISPLTDPTQRILLTGISGQWKVQGSVVDYKIEFAPKENPPLVFTNTPEIDIQILNNLDDNTLNSACQTNKYAESLCRKSELWEQRTNKYFRGKSAEKPTGVTWKNYYFKLREKEGKVYVLWSHDDTRDQEDCDIKTFIGIFSNVEAAIEEGLEMIEVGGESDVISVEESTEEVGESNLIPENLIGDSDTYKSYLTIDKEKIYKSKIPPLPTLTKKEQILQR